MQVLYQLLAQEDVAGIIEERSGVFVVKDILRVLPGGSKVVVELRADPLNEILAGQQHTAATEHLVFGEFMKYAKLVRTIQEELCEFKKLDPSDHVSSFRIKSILQTKYGWHIGNADLRRAMAASGKCVETEEDNVIDDAMVGIQMGALRLSESFMGADAEKAEVEEEWEDEDEDEEKENWILATTVSGSEFVDMLRGLQAEVDDCADDMNNSIDDRIHMLGSLYRKVKAMARHLQRVALLMLKERIEQRAQGAATKLSQEPSDNQKSLCKKWNDLLALVVDPEAGKIEVELSADPSAAAGGWFGGGAKSAECAVRYQPVSHDTASCRLQVLVRYCPHATPPELTGGYCSVDFKDMAHEGISEQTSFPKQPGCSFLLYLALTLTDDHSHTASLCHRLARSRFVALSHRTASPSQLLSFKLLRSVLLSHCFSLTLQTGCLVIWRLTAA